MSFTEIISRTRIRREASNAAAAGQSLDEACPYPIASEAGRCFKAEYLVARQQQAAPTGIAQGLGTPCRS